MGIIKKFLIVFFVISICIVIINVNYLEANASSVFSGASEFIKKGEGQANGVDTTAITNNFLELGQVLSAVGGGILVAVMTYMGIKYLISSPDKQAALKEQLIGVVVSGIVIFGSYGIWKMVVTIARTFD